jgi:hypothetical protein
LFRYDNVTKQKEIMPVVGFNTPSKKIAVAEAEKKGNSPQMGGMPTSSLQAESYERVNDLGEFIMSPQFATLPAEQKQAMLIDFAYYKNVAEALS